MSDTKPLQRLPQKLSIAFQGLLLPSAALLTNARRACIVCIGPASPASPFPPNALMSARTPARPIRRLLSGLLAAIAFTASAAEPPADVVVGFVDMPEPGYYSRTVTPTLAAMARTMPERRVTGVRISPDDPIAQVVRLQPDVLIGPASVYLELELNYGGHSIATRKTRWAEDPSASVGAAVVVRSDNQDIKTLADLRGRPMASGGEDAVDGWLAFLYELKTRRLRPEGYRAHTTFFNYPMPDVITAVLSGKVEAGVLSTCMLERAELAGLLKPGSLRVLDEKTTKGFSCKHTTALYPDIVVASLPKTPPAVVKSTTLALLSMPEDSDFAWQVATNFVSVNRLYKELHLGPWKHLDDWTWENLWKTYGTYALIALAVLAWLILDEIRLKQTVRRRTAALTQALAEREQLEAQEAAARARLARIERTGAINQLCAMIAHELKQPMGSVINYMTVLKIKLADTMANDTIVSRAVAGAEEETRRMAAIVDRVRGYARRDVDRSNPVDLDAAVAKAFAHYSRHAAGSSRLTLSKLPPARILGNDLELELLVINLMKNADQAACDETGPLRQEKPEVTVSLSLEADDAGGPDMAELVVEDNGPAISDEAFERMKRVSDSVKEDGLGLGLAIVRNIVDEHGGRLSIARLSPCGLRVSVAFPTIGPEAPKHAP